MKRFWLIIFFCLVVVVPINALAIEIKQCEYSDEYLKWLTLSEEEKQNTIEPHHCKMEKPRVYKKLSMPFLYGKGIYPSAYSIVEEGYETSVKDQMDTNSCWTFAANASVETYMKHCSGITYDLSERHIEYALAKTFLNDVTNSWGLDRDVDSGGNFYMASAYYYRGLGPIDEKQMPFENNGNLIDITEIQNKNTILDVDDIIFTGDSLCTDDIKDTVKSHLVNYGGFTAGIYFTYSSTYYNYENAALYYNGTALMNHAVTIVGWDDNYSKNNFASGNKPVNDGAWLVRNSWGTDFGKDGYFYISYEDEIVCNSLGGIVSADTEMLDNSYYHDPYGTNSAIGINGTAGSYLYAANVYTKNKDLELLKEVMVSSFDDASVDLYLIEDGSLGVDLSVAKMIGTVQINDGGYRTLKLKTPEILSHDTFIIIAAYKGGSDTPIGVSAKDTGMWSVVNSNANNSYFSADGKNFIDFKQFSAVYIPTIKAETKNINYAIDNVEFVDPLINNIEGGNITFNISTSNIADNEELSVSILNSSDVNVTSKFTYDIDEIINGKTILHLNVPKNQIIASGTYKLIIEYDYAKYESEFIIYQYQNLELKSMSIPEKIFDKKENELIFNLVATNYEDNETITVLITDQNQLDASSLFNISGNTVFQNNASIIIKNVINIPPGKYFISFKIGSHSVSASFEIIEYVEANDISFMKNNIEIGNLQDYLIEYEILPKNYTYANLFWKSSDSNIVTVSQDGVLSAKQRGNASISVIFPDNNHSRSFNVRSVISKITLKDKIISGNYDLDQTAIYEEYGGVVTIPIDSIDVNNMQVNIYNGNNVVSDNFDIELDNEFVKISVLDNVLPGIYCVKAQGSYLVSNEVLSKTESNMVCFEIKEQILVEKIIVNDMIIEELLTGKIEVKINPTQAMNPKLNYKSLDENIASVTSSGVITAKKAGTTTIKITAMDGSNVSSSLKVTVKDSLFDSSGYTLENARIKTGAVSTSYDSFVSKLNITEGLNITVYNDSGIKTYGNIATGDLIVKSNGSLTKKYTVIVRGDISKDGLIKSNDALLIERKVVNILDLDENQLLAADVSKDFKLATNDALLIKRYVVGLIGL